MWNRLSTVSALSLTVGCTSILVGGCVDARGQFDDFSARVVDAAPQIDAPPIDQLPDATGQYLMGLLTLGKTTRFIADITLTKHDDGMTGDIVVTMRSLTIESGQLTNADPVTGVCPPPQGGDPIPSCPVDATGAFNPHFALVLPAAANPITHSTINLLADQHGQLRSNDFFCGTVTGTVVETGTPLDGTTFGAIRIPEGTLGDALPEVIVDCDHEPSSVDAGVDSGTAADAGTTADAGTGADAGIDAAL
jgi:hypothetical protein